ncbi:hypothetical protein [Brevundimonas sp.]|jgi:hypothetical protein
MRAPAINTTQGQNAPVRDLASRLINPVTGYALAIVVSVAFWAILLSAIF